VEVSTVGLKQQLIRDEGVVEHAYEDSLGYLTIGCGHLVDKRRGGSIPRHVIDALLEYDITRISSALYAAFPFIADLDEVRKATLVNMAFQLGVEGLGKFPKAMGFMRSHAYNAAADAFADSVVAREQAPERWKRHCLQIRSGVWQ
jgi:lysozyme